jgi:excisionase family DNA binding protein
MGDRMLTPEEVAERLAVTPNTVRGWLRDGTLKGVKLGKRVWRIEEGEVKSHLCRENAVPYGSEYNRQESIMEKLIEDLDELSSESVEKIYRLVNELIEKESEKEKVVSGKAYLKARKALRQYGGSLSRDIEIEREDRL